MTLVSRGFFLWSKRDVGMPLPLQRALQVAPLAAIVAITAPEIFLAHGELIATWRDARLLAAVAATAFYALVLHRRAGAFLLHRDRDEHRAALASLAARD